MHWSEDEHPVNTDVEEEIIALCETQLSVLQEEMNYETDEEEE